MLKYIKIARDLIIG